MFLHLFLFLTPHVRPQNAIEGSWHQEGQVGPRLSECQAATGPGGRACSQGSGASQVRAPVAASIAGQRAPAPHDDDGMALFFPDLQGHFSLGFVFFGGMIVVAL